MKCKYEQDEICVNDDCPNVADFCPLWTESSVCDFFENCEKKFCKYWEDEEPTNVDEILKGEKQNV